MMYKKIISGAFVAISLQVATLGMEQETEIGVRNNHTAVKIEVAGNNKKLVITSLQDNTPYCLTCKDNAFSIEASDVQLEITPLQSSLPLPWVTENTTSVMTRCDILKVDPFTSTSSMHSFHNDGFCFATNLHTYKNSVFAFGDNGGVHLLPKDLTAHEIKLTENFIENMINLQKLSHSKPLESHKFDLKSTCAVKDIFTRFSPSVEKNENNSQNGVALALVSGTIGYGDSFTSHISFTNTQLEIELNTGFSFKVLDN